MSSTLIFAAALFIIDGDVDTRFLNKNKAMRAAVAQLLEQSPQQFRLFLEELGFDPVRDLKRVEFRLSIPAGEPGPKDKDDLFVIVHGNFHPKRIHSSWAKAKKHTPIKQIKLEGKTAYDGGPKQPMFVIESNKKVLFGMKDVLRQALRGELPKMRKVPPFLRQSKAWVRFRSTPEARKKILKEQQASPFAEIHEIQLRAALVGETLEAKMRMRMRSPEAATGMKMMVNLGLMNSNHPSSMKLGRSLSYRIQGNTLMVDFKMKVAELMALQPPPPPAPGRGGLRIIKEPRKSGGPGSQVGPGPAGQMGPPGGMGPGNQQRPGGR
jgi:hypothetical protein